MTVLDWLLDSDPAIRWQVLRDLVHAPAATVAAERARVATDGWGARLLALQGEDGQWAGGACFPARSSNWREANQGQPWTATLPTLQLLCDFGIDPRSDRVRRAIALVRDHCRWEHAGQSFFGGEVEPCINGRTVTLGTYFDQDMDAVVVRLLGEQLEDGGWNCEVENGSVRSSFATTINVLEGLLAHERATGGSAESIAARRRGEEYLLERKLLRRKSTGAVVNPAWLQFSFPTRWHYDVLRALEYFRAVGDAPDSRMDEAIELLRSKQQPDGTWLLENTHPGKVQFALEGGDGRPSRWNTLRALRVLSWYNQSLPERSAPVPETPTLHLIVGLPGAGKTTLARQLKLDLHALRLTPDEWIETLHGASVTQGVLDDARDPVERLQWDVATRALQVGISVLLDFGFWSREEREHFRSQAALLGARSQVHALLVPLDDLWARLERRNAARPTGTFRVTREQLERWWSQFEPPDSDEVLMRPAPHEVLMDVQP